MSYRRANNVKSDDKNKASHKRSVPHNKRQNSFFVCIVNDVLACICKCSIMKWFALNQCLRNKSFIVTMQGKDFSKEFVGI